MSPIVPMSSDRFGDRPVHLSPVADQYRLGQEALANCLLLAKCGVVVKNMLGSFGVVIGFQSVAKGVPDEPASRGWGQVVGIS